MIKYSIVRIIQILFILTIFVTASEYNKLIIIKSDKTANAETIKNKILNDTSIDSLDINTDKIIKTSQDCNGTIITTIGPLVDNEKFALLYFEIKKLFHNITVKKLLPQSNSITPNNLISPIEDITPKQNEDLTLWIALFTLAITGILALFYSSLQINRIVKQHKIIRKRQEEMERKQHEIFSRMGENIYSMSKEVIENTQKVISNIGEDAQKELKEVVDTENKILYTTNNLLEFLKIKAKKIKIEHKQFKINNMLDDIVGSFVGKYPHKDFELVLDIDHQVPIYAIGDFTNTVTIIRSLIEHQFTIMERGELVVSISVYKAYQDSLELQIKITPYGIIHDDIDAENYFVPDSISNNNTHDRLGLFVAYELVHLLNGDIIAQSLPEGGTVIDISLPIEGIKEERRKYRLPSKKYTQKSVYIVNRYYHASLAQKNLFSYFRHKVKIDSAENFLKNKPNLSEYDIVLIDDDLVYQGFDVYAQMLREKYNVKLVSLSNILRGDKINPYSFNFDKIAKKPLNQEHVFLLIISLYADEIKEEIGEEIQERSHKEFITDIKELPYIQVEDLQDFSNAKILIVEDNEINQRMITTVLNRAGILTDIASNGEEAINMIIEKGPDYYDLVLMDINMPIMDGFTATKKIRELEGTEDLPIVSLTALVLEHEIEKMKDAGMDAFLPKPINLGKLYHTFEIFIGKQKDKKKNTKIDKLSHKNIEGLDIETGLAHSNGNIILYKEILKEFLEVYGTSDNAMQTLYKQKQFDALKQLSLDIMGLAGTIGAKNLYRSANEIYKLFLYNKLSLLPNFLKEYSVEIKKTKHAIEKFLASYN